MGAQRCRSRPRTTRVTISLPAAAPDKSASVVALDIQGAPQIVKPDPYADETPAQRDARMAWWREARFGMFIHWGVYSVPAGTYKGKQVKGIGEWIMNRGKIPVAEYRAFAKEFNPVKFNADEWVRTAKEAGMKYIVITSKHHDGFAMFDSKASDWNIVKASPFGRDPLKELAAACRKYGLKLGFYYSQAQDWNNGGAAAGGKWDPAQERSMDEYIDKVAVPQVKEILTHYGEFPAVLWWDTPTDMNKERAEKLLPLLKLKPGIIHNNRLGGGYKGDTETPEQFVPATGYPGPRLGDLHDHERHLGLQELRPQLEEHRHAHPQPGGHRQQGRQLPAQRRPHLRGPHPGAFRRAAQGDRPMDEGERRGHLRHHRQPLQTPALGPLHQEAYPRRRDPLPARLQLAGGRQAARPRPQERRPAGLRAR